MERDEDRYSTQKKTPELQRGKTARRRFFRILGLVLIVMGVVVITYPLSTFLVTNKAQKKLRSEWKKQVKKTEENKTSDSNTPATQPSQDLKKSTKKSIPPGKAAFRLIIPKIGLDMIVVEGTDTASLKLGPGHISKTVQPGETGVCVVSGHRTTYGAPFFRLSNLKNGDEIVAETTTARFVYKVYEVKSVSPKDTSFIKSTEESILALTTCTPIHSARQRLVVLAKI
jgi:sortase A